MELRVNELERDAAVLLVDFLGVGLGVAADAAEGGEELFVRRDSVQIKGEGLIGLGRVPERDSPLTIRFYCEEA